MTLLEVVRPAATALNQDYTAGCANWSSYVMFSWPTQRRRNYRWRRGARSESAHDRGGWEPPDRRPTMGWAWHRRVRGFRNPTASSAQPARPAIIPYHPPRYQTIEHPGHLARRGTGAEFSDKL